MSYNKIASMDRIEKTIASLSAKNFLPLVVENKEEALAKIKELIPQGVSVMNGASVTLEQIGFVDYLKSGQHEWNNLHEGILTEKDPQKQAQLRKNSVISDFYLGSVHAVTENGELIVASNTGSQLPHIVFTSPNVIFVVGTQKITTDIADGMKRLDEYILALEDERMKQKYGFGTVHSKTLIYHKERSGSERRIYVIFVKEALGY